MIFVAFMFLEFMKVAIISIWQGRFLKVMLPWSLFLEFMKVAPHFSVFMKMTSLALPADRLKIQCPLLTLISPKQIL